MIDYNQNKFLKKNIYINLVTLLFSLGTLVCCVLPFIFVSLGAGAALLGFLTLFPFLVEVSNYKLHIFTISGLLIIISVLSFLFSRRLSCPIDNKGAESCKKLKKISKVMIIFSAVLFSLGFVFNFVI